MPSLIPRLFMNLLPRPLEFGEFVEYSEADVFAAAGPDPRLGKHLLNQMIDADEFEVERCSADGSWEPVSVWRLDELRRSGTDLLAPRQPKRKGGRPRVEDDGAAKELYERGEQLRVKNPGMTRAQIAGRLGLPESTYTRYVRAFKNPPN